LLFYVINMDVVKLFSDSSFFFLTILKLYRLTKHIGIERNETKISFRCLNGVVKSNYEVSFLCIPQIGAINIKGLNGMSFQGRSNQIGGLNL
jgi:hypothetical protein